VRGAALLLVLALEGCSGRARVAPSATPTESAPKEAAAAPLTRRAALRYEIRGRPFPLPLVSGTIAGEPTLMLVDTGTNAHVIAGWLARRLALSMAERGDVGADHAGRSIPSYRVDRPEITIDGWGRLGASTALATEVPEALERLGIGAFISPQRLDEEGDATLVDLAKGELRSAWWDTASRELDRAGAELVRANRGRACEDDDGAVKGLAFVVPAVIEAHEAHLLVDTGAPRSDVFATSEPGRQLGGRVAARSETMYTTSGPILARVVKGARLAAGAFATTVDLDLIEGAPDASCPRDGVLAMDVLRSCALLFGGSRLLGRCAAAR
jgi:hypothetical protein